MLMTNMGHVMTLANSIIGVGILAMPFCFYKCGILLSILLLAVSYFVTRLSCYYLLRAALLARRKSFEFLGFYAFGSSGKLMVELCIIGYLIGTCIAYFVVVGDLGPRIIAKMLNLDENDRLRTYVMVIVTILCIIPLGLLKNVDSLSAVSTASIGFYICLVFKVISESQVHLIANDWYENVVLWDPDGILQCLPIFSMACSCQMQLFEVMETVPNPSLEKMNSIVMKSTKICTCVYILVGLFGYIAFCNVPFAGNILMNFSPTLSSEVIKMGFVLSVAFSFPLVIFPCRVSIYSLIYKRGHGDASTYIPERRFKVITVSIVVISLIVALMIPSIELVIGLVGSTIGVVICVMFPASVYLKLFTKIRTFERTLAQTVLICGFCLMILGTYANLNAIDEQRSGVEIDEIESSQLIQNKIKLPEAIENNLNDKEIIILSSPASNVLSSNPMESKIFDSLVNNDINSNKNEMEKNILLKESNDNQKLESSINNQLKFSVSENPPKLPVDDPPNLPVQDPPKLPVEDIPKKIDLDSVKVPVEIPLNVQISDEVEINRQKEKQSKSKSAPVNENFKNKIDSETIKTALKTAVESDIKKKSDSKIQENEIVKEIPLNNNQITLIQKPGPNTIDKEAIKKDEEIAAEEAVDKEKKLEKAEVELQKTKEMLVKKVDELKQEIVKQNEETQKLVNEKLSDIIEQVKEIKEEVIEEKKSEQHKLPEPLKSTNTSSIISEMNENMIKKDEDEKISPSRTSLIAQLSQKMVEVKEQKRSFNVIKKSVEQINENYQSPKQSDKNVGIDQEIHNKKIMPQPGKVYEPLSYKTGEILNKINEKVPKFGDNRAIPLPILMNSSINNNQHKFPVENLQYTANNITQNNITQENKTSNFKNKNISNKQSQFQKNNVKISSESNIEAIRRDILEVKEKENKIEKIFREKRDLNKNLQFDLVNNGAENQENCLPVCFAKPSDKPNEPLKNLNIVIEDMMDSSMKMMTGGRDLKSIEENDNTAKQ